MQPGASRADRLRRRRLTLGVGWALIISVAVLATLGQLSQLGLLGLAGLVVCWSWLVLLPRRMAPSLSRSLLAKVDADRAVELNDGRLMLRTTIRAMFISFLILIGASTPSLLEEWRFSLARQERPAMRLARAIEQLDRARLAVQPGAIRELERLGSRPDERLAATEALVAFVHRRTRASSASERRLHAENVRAALFTLGRLPRTAHDPPLDLRGVVLVDAQLPHLVLHGVDLTGADLTGADLRGADLRDARLQTARLVGANLWSTNFAGAKLWGANLHEAELRCTNFERADLGGASLLGAPLPAARLVKANLRDTDLRFAYLGRASLRDAEVTGASFRGATGSPGTRWPARFDWRSAGVRADPFGDPNDYCL